MKALVHRSDEKLNSWDYPVPRSAVLNLPVPIHGSVDFKELQNLGLDADSVLDFSANINPYGPFPAAIEALARVPIDRYPDRDCRELVTALSDGQNVSPNRVLVGNGASELIWLAALAFVQAGDRVLVLGPTYCEYARAAALMGASVTTLRAREERAFIPERKEIAKCLMSLRPRLAFLCNPNNPTATLLPVETIAAWARQHPHTLFVVDEAYLPFVGNGTSALCVARENILVFRSMTKDHCLTGLRLGYAIAEERVIALLRRVQPPWSVNALAQAAGVISLGDLTHRRHSLELLAGAKRDLVAKLTRLAYAVVPSTTHFFLMRVGDGAKFRSALLRRGVLVRDCASFGLPEYVRIATRRPEENERLLALLREGV